MRAACLATVTQRAHYGLSSVEICDAPFQVGNLKCGRYLGEGLLALSANVTVIVSPGCFAIAFSIFLLTGRNCVVCVQGCVGIGDSHRHGWLLTVAAS